MTKIMIGLWFSLLFSPTLFAQSFEIDQCSLAGEKILHDDTYIFCDDAEGLTVEDSTVIVTNGFTLQIMSTHSIHFGKDTKVISFLETTGEADANQIYIESRNFIGQLEIKNDGLGKTGHGGEVIFHVIGTQDFFANVSALSADPQWNGQIAWSQNNQWEQYDGKWSTTP